MLVGHNTIHDPDVIQIPNDLHLDNWAKFWIKAGFSFTPLIGVIPGAGMLRNILADVVGQPKRWLDQRRGIEDFNYPGSSHILELLPERPDIIQCHNLHGGYFDLRVLPCLSRQLPVVLTLHDAWLLSGHCAHSFDCDRWKTGCGNCPDLDIYPSIQRDATAYNWRRKQEIYAKSRLYVVTPSIWLMKKVDQSMLAPSILEAKVIPNGVDLSIFHPSDKLAVRAALGIPQDATVLLFTANGIRQNIWKDYQTMRTAVEKVAERFRGKGILFFALGEDAPSEQIGKAEVRFIPPQNDPEVVVRYFQAADIYLHAARADTFPNTVLEALACGTPVVATAVGGIPEQVEDGVSGFLTPQGDAEAMASCIERLLNDNGLRQKMGVLAAESVHKKFDLERQVREYLTFYGQVLEKHFKKSE
jgi:glycosyltransferase involved in cell wall biosynthesis